MVELLTRAHAEPLAADLPSEVAGGGSVEGRASGYALALRIETASRIFASAVDLGIWAIISLHMADAVYPW